jgi:hypothetical protein
MKHLTLVKWLPLFAALLVLFSCSNSLNGGGDDGNNDGNTNDNNDDNTNDNNGGTPSLSGLYDGAVDAEHKIDSGNLASALSCLSSNAETGHNYFIVLGANESASNISLSYPGKTVDITLMGSGAERKINLNASNKVLFTVGTGVTLTLDDKITLVGRSYNRSRLVSVSGTFIMNDGSKITGNTGSEGSSGGVYVYSGTFKKTPEAGGSNSGIIYGSEATGTDADGMPLKNTATGDYSQGDAVYLFSSYKRNTTADQTDYIDTSTGQGLSGNGEAPFGI